MVKRIDDEHCWVNTRQTETQIRLAVAFAVELQDRLASGLRRLATINAHRQHFRRGTARSRTEAAGPDVPAAVGGKPYSGVADEPVATIIGRTTLGDPRRGRVGDALTQIDIALGTGTRLKANVIHRETLGTEGSKQIRQNLATFQPLGISATGLTAAWDMKGANTARQLGTMTIVERYIDIQAERGPAKR